MSVYVTNPGTTPGGASPIVTGIVPGFDGVSSNDWAVIKAAPGQLVSIAFTNSVVARRYAFIMDSILTVQPSTPSTVNAAKLMVVPLTLNGLSTTLYEPNLPLRAATQIGILISTTAHTVTANVTSFTFTSSGLNGDVSYSAVIT